MKGTETRFQAEHTLVLRRHGGVPLVKGTETEKPILAGSLLHLATEVSPS